MGTEEGHTPEAGQPRERELAEGDWVEDISDTVAPSVGPHSTVVHHAQKEAKPSDVDAMGLDKRRAVIGGSYSASFAKQATAYGIVLGVIAALVIGFVILAGQLDKAPDTVEAKAPWSQPEAPQTPVEKLQ